MYRINRQIEKVAARLTGSQLLKIKKVMSEFKDRKLKTPAGKKVTKRDQAVAIAMSEAGVSKKKK